VTAVRYYYSGGGSKKTTTGGRCSTKKVEDSKTNVNDRQHEVSANTTTKDDQLQLGGVDKLPPIDTPDASNVSAAR